MLRKITVLFILLLLVPLQAGAADEKGWYSFIQSKGWYPFEGQSGSSESSGSGEQEKSLVQPTTQPGMGSPQSTTNTTSQGTTQPGQSSWFK